MNVVSHSPLTKQEKYQLILYLEEKRIRNARSSFIEFVKYTKPDYRVNWHHQLIADKLDKFARGEITYLMIFAPPRHGKSELVSRRLPAYLHGLYPDAEIMAASYLDSLASDMTIDIQKIIDTEPYQILFPNTKIYPWGTRYTEGTRNASEHHIINHRGKYRGQGVGGSFTGRGATHIIIDDPIKGREIASSLTFRDRLWDFYNNDLFSRLETNLVTGKKGQVLITQTRWSEDDLSARLIDLMNKDKNAVQWDIVSLPALRSDFDLKEDTRKLNEPLWPEKYNLQQLNQIKASIGASSWASLYQQSPVADGGNLFEEQMFRFAQVPGSYDYTFVTVDTSYKEKQENDFTVFSSWGVMGEQIYLRDVFMRQMKSSDIEGALVPWVMTQMGYGYRGTWIEPKGHGIYLNQKLAGAGLAIPSESDLKDFYSDRRFDKVERANNVIPHLAYRFVYFNQDLSNKEELVAQCLGFPKSRFDDFVDTFIDALKIVYFTKPSILDYC